MRLPCPSGIIFQVMEFFRVKRGTLQLRQVRTPKGVQSLTGLVAAETESANGFIRDLGRIMWNITGYCFPHTAEALVGCAGTTQGRWPMLWMSLKSVRDNIWPVLGRTQRTVVTWLELARPRPGDTSRLTQRPRGRRRERGIP